MELLGLVGLLFFLYLLIAPLVAWVRASSAQNQVEAQAESLRSQAVLLEKLRREVAELTLALRTSRPRSDAPGTEAASADRAHSGFDAIDQPDGLAEPVASHPGNDAGESAPIRRAATPTSPARTGRATYALDPAEPVPPVVSASPGQGDDESAASDSAIDLPAPLPTPPRSTASENWTLADGAVDAAQTSPVAPAVADIPAPSPVPEASTVPAASALPGASAVPGPSGPALAGPGWSAPTPNRPRPPPPRPRPPAAPPKPPSEFEEMLAKGWKAARGWLFGGNLVAKIGLMILFIGVAFLLRYASAYVVVPIEFRLAGIAAGAIALLAWGWSIRKRRPGIALPVQGAGLATLMLVSFGAFKLYNLIPAGPTFALLLVLVAFTCVLAVLQNALWLAIFGIVGGFAVPILTSTGEGSHVALFSYYALLNGGILAIAWTRSWRSLNVLGFLFTFLIGTYWGVQRYSPEHYASSQFFLALFLLFYVAIAILYAWRQAPQLKSYVDGTLVFGVPTVAMGLQYGLVKDFELGSALSAVALGLFYGLTAAALWQWRRGNLRLLVESFLALAVVFGTLAIPLAFDGRWTSAAWALEGAGIVWIGLRQRQPLVWRFGIAVQIGAWFAFVKALTGIDPLIALRDHFSLGFLLLGATGVFMALLLRRPAVDADAEDSDRQRQGFGWLATAFMAVAVLWLLAGLWLEVWLRVGAEYRASLYVLTAIGLVVGLQWLGRRSDWRLPAVLGGIVSGIAGLTFLALMARYMRWYDLPDYHAYSFGQMLANGALFGGLLLTGAALVSAFGFKRRASERQTAGDDAQSDERAASGWLLLAIFWFAGFALHGLAHALAWFSAGPIDGPAPWYQISFWAGYSVAVAASGWGFARIADRWAFPNAALVVHLVFPLLLAIGGYRFLVAVSDSLPALAHLLDFRHSAGLAGDGSVGAVLLAWLGGPLSGSLILALLAWSGLAWVRQRDRGPALSDEHRPSLTVLWLLGLIVVLHLPIVDGLALLSTQLLLALGASSDGWLAWLSYADARLLWMGALAMLGVLWAKRQGRSELRWLALPTALIQALASVHVLAELYFHGRLPTPGTGIALLGLWLALAWVLRSLQRETELPRPLLQAAHFGRVIAPWLMLAPVLSLNLLRWLNTGADPAMASDGSWVVAGMWPDYLAAWVCIGLLLLGLRQVRGEGWPLAPLGSWYGNLVIPLAGLWALLLAIYWNLRQDGSMAPLPYLPLLNPLDLTSAFVALLLIDLWRLHRDRLGDGAKRLLQRCAMALAFGWFNLMLLRSAAQYLGLPYRFSELYASQFIQAMLSIVWTLCAFALMRYAVRRMSKPVWMIGAVLLGAVVLKLFLIDLRNVGGIERVISFMGVGGLMLLIGYLAPLPRSVDPDEVDDERKEAGP